METRKGGRLIDRPEFKSKPQPITFLGKNKVSDAINVMADKNYGVILLSAGYGKRLKPITLNKPTPP